MLCFLTAPDSGSGRLAVIDIGNEINPKPALIIRRRASAALLIAVIAVNKARSYLVNKIIWRVFSFNCGP